MLAEAIAMVTSAGALRPFVHFRLATLKRREDVL